MQTPVFLILFLAPVYVPLELLTSWIHAVAVRQPDHPDRRGRPRPDRRRLGRRRHRRSSPGVALVDLLRGLGDQGNAPGRGRRLAAVRIRARSGTALTLARIARHPAVERKERDWVLRGLLFGRVHFGRPAVLAVLGSLAWTASASAVITTPFGPGRPDLHAGCGRPRLHAGSSTPSTARRSTSSCGLPGDTLVRSDGPYPLVMVLPRLGREQDDDVQPRSLGQQGLRGLHDERPRLGDVLRRPRTRSACSRLRAPDRSKGYNHLMDTRFEVRDAQVMAGKLVDNGRGHRRTRSARPAAPTAAASRWPWRR